MADVERNVISYMEIPCLVNTLVKTMAYARLQLSTHNRMQDFCNMFMNVLNECIKWMVSHWHTFFGDGSFAGDDKRLFCDK